MFAAAASLSKADVILAYCYVVAAAICSNSVWLLVEAAARLSK